MKFGIFPRLTAGYLVVLLLLGASNVYALFKLAEFSAVILSSYNEDIRALNLEERLADAIFSQRRYEQKYLLTRDPALFRQFSDSRADFDKALRELRALPLPPAATGAMADIDRNYRRYSGLIDTEVEALSQNRRLGSNRSGAEKETAVEAILAALETLESASGDEMSRKAAGVSRAGAAVRWVAVLSFVVTMGLALLFAFLITRSITRPLIMLVRKTREIPATSFTCDLAVSAPPEVLELADAFNRMCDKLLQTDRMKADFFAMISHELKTPLTTIKEGTSLLLEGACGSVSEEQRRLLAIISDESNRLTGLVGSILDLSKMEAGMMKYHFAEEPLGPLVGQAVGEVEPYARAKGLTLETKIAPDLGSCRMDAERILDALRNLIGNAVKFTPAGGRITVAAAPVKGGLEISVSDTGPGIPPEKLETIFEKYESTDTKKGTGLGLTIVKHITTAHGGRVWAESAPGEETSFYLFLPC